MAKDGGFDEPEWMKDDSPGPDSKGPLFVMKERLSYLDLTGRVWKGSIQFSRGGYSDVFSGTYVQTDGSSLTVAVKELRVHIMKERKLQRSLARELYIWSKLNHPNILPFYGLYIEHNIYPHLVSPWMKNGTIMSYLELNPSDDVVSLVQGIAKGICYLHANRIIHSDIKPDNILMSDLGQPLLCDFGVSRILESSVSFQTSTTSTARGTLRYMSKEVILAEDGETYSKQADVWAFGMTVYNIITKRLPYHHIQRDASVVLEIYSGKLPSWPEDSEPWPAGSRGLKPICESCWLGKSERPSMEDVASRLDTIFRESRSTMCIEWLDEMRSQLTFNVCNIESSYLWNGEVPKLDHIKDSSLNAIKSANTTWLNYALQTNDVDALRGPVTDFFSSLSALRWIELLSLLGELDTGKAILTKCIDHFKSEDRIVLLATEWIAFISDFNDAISKSAPHVYISALSWGVPSSTRCFRSQRLSLSEKCEVFEPSRNSAKDTGQLNHILRNARWITFSPDGKTFASGHADGNLRIWDTDNGELIRTIKAHGEAIIYVEFSSDGRRVITASFATTLRIWEVETGDLVLQPLWGHTASVFAIACSPDGTRIASGSLDRTIRIWDMQSGSVTRGPLLGHDDFVRAVSYSPNGSRIVSASGDRTLRIWDARTGEEIGEPLRGHSNLISCVEYSPDGSRIASGSFDTTVRIWDAQTGRPLGEPLEGHRDSVQAVAYTPDGSRIISGSWDNSLRIWNAHTGSAIGVIPRGESRWDSNKSCFLSIPSWWPVYSHGSWLAPPVMKALIHSDAPIQILDDGWLRTLDGNPFVWVPPKYREDICYRGLMGNIPPRLKFDWKRVPHGKDWTKIKEMFEEPIDH